MDKDTIIVCEPQCWGFEHSAFNASLLRTLKLAYPTSDIYFYGEKNHLRQVDSVLRHRGYEADDVKWCELLTYPRNAVKWKRLFNEFSWCNTIMNLAKQSKAKLLSICSINNTGILALKTLMHLRQFQTPTIAIPHSCLASLLLKESWRPWSMKNALSLCPPKSLKLVALGQPILDEVLKLASKYSSQWVSIDHPYLWQKIPRHNTEQKPDTIRFGFFGAANTGKGFDKFCHIADRVSASHNNAEFILVGFYWGFNSESVISKYVQGVGGIPLSVGEFHQRANSITYSVWLAEPTHYRLTASATFLDSLAYAIPGIYLRNPFIEYYFEQMGDIGYLCDTIEEVYELMKQIVTDFPSSRYHNQVANILTTRKIFSPEFLAKRLREWYPC